MTAAAGVLGLLGAQAVCAQSFLGADQGKLPLTAGFSDLEGSGGGGLVPFAVISGYGSNTSWGANAHFTNIQLRDLHLYTYGVSAGVLDRVELSYTRQQLDVTGTALDGLGVKQDVYGLITCVSPQPGERPTHEDDVEAGAGEHAPKVVPARRQERAGRPRAAGGWSRGLACARCTPGPQHR